MKIVMKIMFNVFIKNIFFRYIFSYSKQKIMLFIHCSGQIVYPAKPIGPLNILNEFLLPPLKPDVKPLLPPDIPPAGIMTPVKEGLPPKPPAPPIANPGLPPGGMNVGRPPNVAGAPKPLLNPPFPPWLYPVFLPWL